MGSWTLYGLGTENQDLPGFITIKPALSHGGSKNWASAFLPGAYQGTAIGNAWMKIDEIQGEPIEYLLNKHYSAEVFSKSLVLYSHQDKVLGIAFPSASR